ncbi:unnamed protein product [Rotaria magnacalcarata]|uniref:Uncharacterized protein n=1 Tax=Rotaria magnacalcarata TaxID=392030 RepID=A0A819IPE7_9BILA|nr:unnamed protein product [Rotaria magnacalcarata]
MSLSTRGIFELSNQKPPLPQQLVRRQQQLSPQRRPQLQQVPQQLVPQLLQLPPQRLQQQQLLPRQQRQQLRQVRPVRPCASVSTAILQNSCTTSLVNPVTLLYLSDISPNSGYVQYSYSYLSTANSITISLAFRQDPSYWAFDDISITLSTGGPNLVQNPGFETGSLTGYYAFCNPSSSSASGTVYAGYAHTGTYCYYDGSVGNPDYI